MTSPLIFVSHAEFEGDFADHIVARLRDALPGASFFQSSGDSLKPGDSWRQKINHALADSAVVLAFISRQSATRPWILFESGFAAGSGSRLIPVIIDDLPTQGVAAALLDFEFVRLTEEDGFAKLAHTIAQIIHIGVDRTKLHPAKLGAATSDSELGTTPGVYVGKSHNDIAVGWQQYTGNAHALEIRSGYVSVAGTFSDGFRYPPRDSLNAPWHYFGFRILRTQEVQVYAILKYTDESAGKLHVSTLSGTWGFIGESTDEYWVPIASMPRNRWSVVVIDVRTFESDFRSPVCAIIGLRIRGPISISHIWCVDDLADIHSQFRDGALSITYPGSHSQS